MLSSTELYGNHQIKLWKRERLIHVTWEDAALAVDNIVGKILRDSFQPDVIVAISRGGLMPALLLSHKLGVRNLEVVTARYYGSGYYPQRLSEKPIIGPASFQTQYDSALLVDDIAGSGETISEVSLRLEDKIEEVRSATLVKNVNCPIDIDYFALRSDDFVVFPWERHGRKSKQYSVPKTWIRKNIDGTGDRW